MFGLISGLAKAAAGVVVATPVAIVADALTLGGSLTDKKQPYTATAVSNVVKNIEKATK